MLHRRPKRGDDEEDLLEFQSQFFASGEKPSVKIVRCGNKSNNRSGRDDSSSITAESARKNGTDQSESPDDKYKRGSIDMTETPVLSFTIKERDIVSKKIVFPQPSKQVISYKVPIPKEPKAKRQPTLGKSLFAQHFNKNCLTIDKIPVSGENVALNEKPIVNTPEIAVVSSSELHHENTESILDFTPTNVLSHGEKASIQKENIEKLSHMTDSEILAEQNKLKASLDPRILSFLANRTKSNVKEENIANCASVKIESGLEIVESRDLGNYSQEDTSTLLSNNKWIHMDDHEEDKVKWMEQISVSKSKDSNISLPGRFDFEGRLLTFGESEVIPSHLGLHHHGDNPELAGYTLQEIVTLSRSNVMQQRTFALKLLAKIMTKDKHGEYHSLVPNAITLALLNAGITFIIRWSLDQTSNSILLSSVNSLWSLIMPHYLQQEYLDIHFLTFRGCEYPCFKPLSDNTDSDKSKMSDFEVANEDLISGLLRMDLLPRVRYVLEICQLDLSTICKCCEVLVQICQHSTSTALKVLECPRLIAFLIEAYLPMSWHSSDQSNMSNCPLPQALRILRAICQSGRHAAARLIHDHKSIVPFMMGFVAQVGGVDNESLVLLETELEVWKLWTVCLSYGLLLDICRDTIPTLMLQVQACIKHLDRNCEAKKLLWIRHIIKFVSCFFANIPVCQKNIKEPMFENLQWIEIKGFSPLVSTLVQKVVTTLNSIGDSDSEVLGIIAAGMDFFASYYIKAKNNTEAIEMVDEIETDTLPNVIRPLEHVIFMQFQALCTGTILVSVPHQQLSCSCDLGLGCLSKESQSNLISLTQKQNLFCAYFRCSYTLCKLNRRACVQYVPLMSKFCQMDVEHVLTSTLANKFLHRLIHHTLYWLVKLFSLAIMECPALQPQVVYYHKVALKCFSSFIDGDEHYAHDILSNVLFHTTLMSAFSESDNVCKLSVPDMLSELPSIRSVYMKFVNFGTKQLVRSMHWSNQNAPEVLSFLLPVSSTTMLPTDWPYLPIMYLYDMALRGESENPSKSFSNYNTIRFCLKYLVMMEMLRPNYLKPISITAKLARLMCVYVVEGETFLECEIKNLLQCLFKHYCAKDRLCHIDFNQSIPGIVSFYDFYMSLLEQYEAVSYGDPLFSAVILLPLVQLCDPKLKLALWSQHSGAIRTINLKRSDLLLPYDSYVFPAESNHDIVRAYVGAIVGEICRKDQAPFLYELAVHHVVSYLSNESHDKQLREELLHAINSIKNMTVKEDILSYHPVTVHPVNDQKQFHQ